MKFVAIERTQIYLSNIREFHLIYLKYINRRKLFPKIFDKSRQVSQLLDYYGNDSNFSSKFEYGTTLSETAAK